MDRNVLKLKSSLNSKWTEMCLNKIHAQIQDGP